MPLLRQTLQDRAHALGFTLFGLIPAEPAPHLEAYLAWLDKGYHGEMGYMARPDRVARRRDLRLILPSVRSLILVGVDYADLGVPMATLRDPLRGRIARYAWGADYHAVLGAKLEALAATLPPLAGESARVYVDTGALLERSHANRAGLGFIGKNTLLIHPKRGSYLFLGEILSAHDFDRYDDPAPASLCAACTRCLRACPTEAFPAPYVLDARRCISYWTIEAKGAIPPDLAPQFGNWIYGCDDCQDVCPYVRRFTRPTPLPEFRAFSPDTAAPPLRDLLALTPEAFTARYRGTPLARLKYARFMRNVCVAVANSGARDFIPALHRLAEGADFPLVAESARTALARLEDGASTARPPPQ